MIINGGSRSSGAFFAKHLMREDHNERVTVVEMRGFGHAENVPEAFAEMRDWVSETRCKNFFYHANLNTRRDEVLTPEQWAEAVDTLERELRFDGQARFVIEHEKDGRTHQHVVWSRFDPETMNILSDSFNYRAHELVAAELETRFGHQTTARALTRDKETAERPEPNVKDWESFRAQDSKIDPKAMKAELTELWQHSDSGPAFAAALTERGYILARGDRRDFCVIDQAGDEHSLGRRVGVKAAEIRARMEGIDRDTLPSVDEARQLVRQRPEEAAGDATGSVEALHKAEAPEAPHSPFAAILEGRQAEAAHVSPEDARPAFTTRTAQPAHDDAFAQVFEERLHESARQTEDEPADTGARAGRFAAWLSTMREHVASFTQQVRDYWHQHFGHHAPEPAEETPATTVQPESASTQPMQQQGGPEIG